MHDLQPITALGGLETRIDKFERIIIIENDDLALASVAVVPCALVMAPR